MAGLDTSPNVVPTVKESAIHLRPDAVDGNMGFHKNWKEFCTVWYLLEMGPEKVWLRFSDIIALDEAIRSAMRGNHLYSNLPRLDGASIFSRVMDNKLMRDPWDEEFIKARLQSVDNYFSKIGLLPESARKICNAQIIAAIEKGLAEPPGDKYAGPLLDGPIGTKA